MTENLHPPMNPAVIIESIQELDVPLEGRAKELVLVAETFEITDQSSAGRAADLIGQVKAAWDQIEQQRDTLVRPHNEVVAAYNQRIKAGILTPLKGAETRLKNLVKSFTKAKRQEAEVERRAQATEQRRIELERKEAQQQAEADAAAAGEPPPPPPPPEPPPPPAADPSSTVHGEYGRKVTIIEKWVFELTELEAVPRAFLQIDERAVNDAIRDGRRKISGLRIWDEGTTRAG